MLLSFCPRLTNSLYIVADTSFVLSPCLDHFELLRPQQEMHFFDPTLDWPKELLEEQMPDLVVIRSNNLKDPNAPWYGIDNAWRTSWIQFAAADGDHHFLSMTFLDGLSACNDDRKEVATYLTALSGSGVETRQYRSTSSVSNLPILSTGESP